ncbi:type I-E CRISPR-associated protein Cas5/CasD [Micromonospora sonneratiae]|uniref:Type I-E CRISPR-associated protein Cas5/CasD n=1 Tax=Micromonospora sonneratiae TaxID=1184706 RepID=A0ABW3YMB2_9ACTN
MNGLLIRLAGPMQSWGDHSTFSERDTRPHPTRSALIGMIAAALGRGRDQPFHYKSADEQADVDLPALSFTIRVDRPGTPMQDFHTVGGGLPRARTVMTAEGKRRAPGTETIVSRRQYLADAVFTVAVTGPEATIAVVAEALAQPVWAPYLGRRSCPAEVPLLLRGPGPGVVDDLYRSVPLARSNPYGGADTTVDVDFVLDTPPPDAVEAARLTYNDVPVAFHPHRRSYLSRSIWVVTEKLPVELCAGFGSRYLTALERYLEGAAP